MRTNLGVAEPHPGGLLRTTGELLLLAALAALTNAAWAGEFRPVPSATTVGESAWKHQKTRGHHLSLPEAWGAAKRGALWVDARPADLFSRGHHPGAVPLTEERWGDQLGGVLERWNPEMPVIVYCEGGDCRASERVAARLRDEGLDPVFVLRGGWEELRKAGSGNVGP